MRTGVDSVSTLTTLRALMKTILALLLTVSFLPALSAADLKIAVIDMKRATNEYTKGKEAANKLKANADKFGEERKAKYAEFQKEAEGMQSLQKKAQDPILAQGERAKAGAQLQAKVKELRTMEGEIKEFEQRRAGQLREEESQVRAEILKDLSDVVNKLAKDGGYNLVIDKTGNSISTIPIVMYVDGVPDLTDAVITEINKGAPAPSEEVKKAK